MTVSVCVCVCMSLSGAGPHQHSRPLSQLVFKQNADSQRRTEHISVDTGINTSFGIVIYTAMETRLCTRTAFIPVDYMFC